MLFFLKIVTHHAWPFNAQIVAPSELVHFMIFKLFISVAKKVNPVQNIIIFFVQTSIIIKTYCDKMFLVMQIFQRLKTKLTKQKLKAKIFIL